MIKMVPALFQVLFFVMPFVFFPGTSEAFEFNKIVGIYIFTVLIVSAWIIKSINQKKVIFRRSRLDIPLLFFLGSQALSAYFSIDPRTSIFGYYSRFNGGLLSLVSYALLYWAYTANMTARDTKYVIRNTIYAGVGVATWAIFEHYGYSLSCLIIKGQFNTVCWEQDLETRVFATLGQPNWLAAYMVALLPISNYEFLISKDRMNKVLWSGATGMIFAAILFTKSRSGLLAFGISYIVFWGLVLFNNRRYRKVFLNLSFVLVFIFGVTQIGQTKPIDTTGMLITPSSEIRKIVWQGALDVWKKYPVVGSGVETFAFSYFKERPAKHNLTSEWDLIYNKAHNEYLNYLATTGVVGLGSYLLVVFTSLTIFVKELRIKNYELCLALMAGYVSILATNFFGFSVVTTSLLFFLMPAMVASSTESRIKYQELRISRSFQVLGSILLMAVTGYLLLITIRYWQADYLYAQGKYEEAIKTNPREPLYYAALGTPEIMKQAMVMSPRNIKILEMAANRYMDLATDEPKYYLMAIQTYEELVILAPTYARFYYNLGMSYLALGNTTKGTEMLERALILKPNYEKAERLLGIIGE